MTKADLVEEVTQIGDLTRRDGEVVVDTVFDAVIQALQAGDKIEIRGFGSFRIRQRKPRTGRNPKTGDKVEVPAKRVPYFKPSKELRDLVNPKGEASGPKNHSVGFGCRLSEAPQTYRNPRHAPESSSRPTAGSGSAAIASAWTAPGLTSPYNAHHPPAKPMLRPVRKEHLRLAVRTAVSGRNPLRA